MLDVRETLHLVNRRAREVTKEWTLEEFWLAVDSEGKDKENYLHIVWVIANYYQNQVEENAYIIKPGCGGDLFRTLPLIERTFVLDERLEFVRLHFNRFCPPMFQCGQCDFDTHFNSFIGSETHHGIIVITSNRSKILTTLKQEDEKQPKYFSFPSGKRYEYHPNKCSRYIPDEDHREPSTDAAFRHTKKETGIYKDILLKYSIVPLRKLDHLVVNYKWTQAHFYVAIVDEQNIDYLESTFLAEGERNEVTDVSWLDIGDITSKPGDTRTRRSDGIFDEESQVSNPSLYGKGLPLLLENAWPKLKQSLKDYHDDKYIDGSTLPDLIKRRPAKRGEKFEPIGYNANIGMGGFIEEFTPRRHNVGDHGKPRHGGSSTEQIMSKPQSTEISPESEGTDYIYSEPEGTDYIYSEPEGTDYIYPEPEGTDDIYPEPEGTDYIYPEPEGTEIIKPKPDPIELIGSIFNDIFRDRPPIPEGFHDRTERSEQRIHEKTERSKHHHEETTTTHKRTESNYSTHTWNIEQFRRNNFEQNQHRRNNFEQNQYRSKDGSDLISSIFNDIVRGRTQNREEITTRTISREEITTRTTSREEITTRTTSREDVHDRIEIRDENQLHHEGGTNRNFKESETHHDKTESIEDYGRNYFDEFLRTRVSFAEEIQESYELENRQQESRSVENVERNVSNETVNVENATSNQSSNFQESSSYHNRQNSETESHYDTNNQNNNSQDSSYSHLTTTRQSSEVSGQYGQYGTNNENIQQTCSYHTYKSTTVSEQSGQYASNDESVQGYSYHNRQSTETEGQYVHCTTSVLNIPDSYSYHNRQNSENYETSTQYRGQQQQDTINNQTTSQSNENESTQFTHDLDTRRSEGRVETNQEEHKPEVQEGEEEEKEGQEEEDDDLD